MGKNNQSGGMDPTLKAVLIVVGVLIAWVMLSRIRAQAYPYQPTPEYAQSQQLTGGTDYASLEARIKSLEQRVTAVEATQRVMLGDIDALANAVATLADVVEQLSVFDDEVYKYLRGDPRFKIMNLFGEPPVHNPFPPAPESTPVAPGSDNTWGN